MRWRRGEGRCARGEVAIPRGAAAFDYWYPTVKVFAFRRTISFWGPVSCIEGCLQFLAIYMFDFYGGGRADLSYLLTKLPNLLGGTMFLIGIYLAYFEIINLDTPIDTRRPNFFWCDWRATLALEVDWASAVGPVMYLGGAVLYFVSQVSDLFALGPERAATLVEWPPVIGGLCFFLGGCCELKINRVFFRPPTELVWWVAVLNGFGGATFWLSACPSVFAGQHALIVGIGGTFAYLAAASLSLVMWRGEQFGGALIPALNAAQRDAAPFTVRTDPFTGVAHVIVSSLCKEGQRTKKLEDVLTPKLSAWGLAFLHVYVFIGAFQSLACFMCMEHVNDYWHEPDRFTFFLNIFLSGFCHFVLVHMLLVLTSACVCTPKEEPYRTLLMSARLVSLFLLANSWLTLEVLYRHSFRSLEHHRS